VKKAPLFFVALLPPEDLQREISAFKKHIANTWGACHALKSPPHITLQPPFDWPENELASLKNASPILLPSKHPSQLTSKTLAHSRPASFLSSL